MRTTRPQFQTRPLPTLPTVEEPNVARFLVVPGSDGGFLIPSDQHPQGDLHLQRLDAPGVIRDLPAVLLFRTQYLAGSRFSVRVNGSTEFQFQGSEARAQSWHEVIAPGVLREEDNEIVLFVAPDNGGQVIFSEIAVLYTSNKLTVTRPIVLDPAV